MPPFQGPGDELKRMGHRDAPQTRRIKLYSQIHFPLSVEKDGCDYLPLNGQYASISAVFVKFNIHRA